MERTYRLEFNEKQQYFHLDNFTHEENTHGWFTIFEHCTDFELKVYQAYVYRIPKKKLTKAYLTQCAIEIKGFMNKLTEYKLIISNS